MGIGASIFLIAVGLVLALAVEVDIAGLNIDVVGWILVAVGVVGLMLTLTVFASRRPPRTTGAVVEERRTYDDPAL